jgi:hypothetical protein
MDYIVGLPNSDGYDACIVIVDRFSKLVVLKAFKTTMNTSGLIKLLSNEYFGSFGYPASITADRDPKHQSQLFRQFCEEKKIALNLSTAFHPETNGQSERMVQYVEGLLRCHPHLDFEQGNWSTILGDVSFVINNSYQSSTGLSPYKIVFGMLASYPEDKEVVDVSPIQARKRYGSHSDIHQYVKSMIEDTQSKQAKYFDYHRRSTPSYKVGDQVMLSAQNINTIRPSKKLDFKRLDPFTIVDRVSTHAYRLDLPSTMKIHNVFHVGLLEKYTPSDIPGQLDDPPPPVIVDGEEEYGVENIISSRSVNCGKKRKIQYLVEWTGYGGTEEETTWQDPEDLTNSVDKVKEFHNWYPNKPRAPEFDREDRPKRSRRSIKS